MASGKSKAMQAVRRIVSAVLIVGVALSVISHSGGIAASAFQYHPIMMCCAFIGVLPEVMKGVSEMKSGPIAEPLIVKHQTHTALFQLSAYSAFAAVEYTKIQKGYPHLSTPHGMVGAVCAAALVCQGVMGVLLRYVLSYRSSLRKPVKSIHGLLSLTIALTGTMCVAGGMLATSFAESMIPCTGLRTAAAFAGPVLMMWAYMV